MRLGYSETIRPLADLHARWASRQDAGETDPGATVGAWIGATVVIYGLIAACLWLGAIGRNDATCALLAPAPAVVHGFAVGTLRRTNRLSWPHFLVCLLTGTTLLVFAFTMLLVVATGPAAGVFAALVLVTAGMHSWATRSGADAPLSGVAAFVGMALAFAVDHRASAWPVLGVTFVLAMYLSVQLGTWSVRAVGERARLDAYRAALQAQHLSAQSRRTDELEQALNDVLATNHDHRNMLLLLSMNIGNLADEASPLERTVLVDMQKAIDDMTALLDGQRRAPPLREGSVAKCEPVDLGDVVPTVTRIVKVRHAIVRVLLDLPPSTPRLLVRGGATALHRILLNLLLNGCEGDGRSGGASQITLRARLQPDADVVRLQVIDDGPGFPESVLESSEPFVTTKRNGTGLGLVTVRGLVCASGGNVSLRNDERGGAVVTIDLPVASPGSFGEVGVCRAQA